MTTTILLTTAVFIGFTHTLIGIDHYVPFVVLSKANAWSMKKTMLIVFVCGIGHVLSSVLLGLFGIALSQSLSFLVNIESIRGSLATSFLIGFGLVYTAWALTQLYKNKPHTHLINGEKHTHDHHGLDAAQTHHEVNPQKSLNTIWGLFILFVLGPCEPLIPLLMFPAATQKPLAFFGVILAFSSITILTMLGATWIGLKGLKYVKLEGLEKYTHMLAGSAITLCGIMILTLGI
jgi:nickel/cobalt transporter (NicO) family protein